MKLRIFSLLLVGLLAMSTFAVTIDTWVQSGTVVGNWTDPCMWKSSTVKVMTTVTADEFKLTTNGGVTTINTAVGSATNFNRLTVAAGGLVTGDDHTLKIATGADVYVSNAWVGFGNAGDKGKNGNVIQTGGILTVGNVQLGIYGTRTAGGPSAIGTYRISGGTLQKKAGTTGRLLVGTGITTGATSANNEGVFTVVGTGGTIDMNELYVGATSGGTYKGTGTVAFEAAVGGISKIVVSTGIILDAGGAASVAKLVVYRGNSHGDLVLIENTGASAVSGLFDSLNGGLAGEGQGITLGGAAYTLTYVFNAATGAHTGGNDIALIPEPATIALLTLGLIAIRRKK